MVPVLCKVCMCAHALRPSLLLARRCAMVAQAGKGCPSMPCHVHQRLMAFRRHAFLSQPVSLVGVYAPTTNDLLA